MQQFIVNDPALKILFNLRFNLRSENNWFLYAMLFCVACSLYVLYTSYRLRNNKDLNHMIFYVFVLYIITILLVQLNSVFMKLSESPETAMYWDKVFSPGFFFNIPLSVHLVSFYSRRTKAARKYGFAVLPYCYVLSALLGAYYMLFYENTVQGSKTMHWVIFHQEGSKLFPKVFICYFYAGFLFNLYLLVKNAIYKRNEYLKESNVKKQEGYINALMISIGSIISLPIIFFLGPWLFETTDFVSFHHGLSITTLCTLTSFIIGTRFFNLNEELFSSRLKKVYREKNDALKVSEEMRKEAERQRQRAEQSERNKQQLLTFTNHELRDPLNIIAKDAELALDEHQSPQNLTRFTRINKSCDRLKILADEILDISKLEAGKWQLKETSFNIREQISDIKESLCTIAEDKNLLLETIISADLPQYVTGDKECLYKLLRNLINNSINCTEKGSVKLFVEVMGNELYRFTVSDTGIGIPPEKMNLIFEAYTQVVNNITGGYAGTGLGLNMVKKILELMGGKIQVKSEVGKGSEFSFTITLKTAPEPQVSVRKITTKNEAVKQLGLQLKSLRILLVEDYEYSRILAMETLKKFIPDVRITDAGNGKDALEKLQQDDYDIILMDLRMPVIDGYTVAQQIRTTFSSDKRSIPILALTGSVTQEEKDRCLQSGINEIIAKPVSTEQLITKIYKEITLSEQRQSL